MNYSWQSNTHQIPWELQGLEIMASAAVTAAGTTTPVKVGKGIGLYLFDVTAVSNGTGDVLRAEIQFNRLKTASINVHSKIVFDADFVTSNTIDITVNGVAASQVTFATDHSTTAGLVQAAVDALAGVTCVLDVTDANERTFLISKDDRELAIGTVTEAVAAGGSQATGTITYDGDWVTAAIMTFDDAIQGGRMDAVGKYPLLVENLRDYQVRIRHTIVNTPSTTYSCAVHPIRSRLAT